MDTALIGIVGVIVGIVLSNFAARFLESLRRKERIQDVSTAIRAEIRSHRQRLLLFEPATAGEITERILEEAGAGSEYTPFVPAEAPSFVFDAILSEIHILPTEVIDPVIYYYRQTATLKLFAEDLRSDRFSKLEAWRKAEMYRDYIAMGEYALELAEKAVKALEDSSVTRLRPSRA